MDFLDLCDAAYCAPDTRLTDQELADRYEKHTGQSVSVAAVTKARDEFWQRLHAAPSVHIGTWRI